MKNVIKFKVIDGIEIVTGFTTRLIDLRATKRVVTTILNEAGLPDYMNDSLEDLRMAEAYKGPGEEKKKYRAAARKRAMLAQSKYKNEIKSIQSDNIQYLVLPAGQREISPDQDLVDAFKALKRGELLTTSGDVVRDCRGMVYWNIDAQTGDWIKTVITTLGETKPVGSKLYKNLTDDDRADIRDQLDGERLAALTDDDRERLKAADIATAEHQAARMRSVAEIKGVSAAAALANAQEWLAEREAEITEKYAVV